MKTVADCDCNTILADDVGAFSGGLAAIRLNGMWGFVDIHGRLVIPPTYASVSPFREGLSAVTKSENGPTSFIDTDGKPSSPSLPADYEQAETFVNGVSVIEKDGLVSAMDHTGKTVIQPSPDWVLQNSNAGGPALRLWRKDVYLRLDSKGNTLTRFQPYAQADVLRRFPVTVSVGQAAGGRVPASSGGAYHFVDLTGHWSAAPVFEELRGLKNGHALAKQKGLYGLVDPEGKWQVPAQWGSIDELPNGFYKLTPPGDPGPAHQPVFGQFDEHGLWKQLPELRHTLLPGLDALAADDTGTLFKDIVDASGHSVLLPAWKAAFQHGPPQSFSVTLLTSSSAAGIDPLYLISFSVDEHGGYLDGKDSGGTKLYALFSAGTRSVRTHLWDDVPVDLDQSVTMLANRAPDATGKDDLLVFRASGKTLRLPAGAIRFADDWSEHGGFISVPSATGTMAYALFDNSGKQLTQALFDDPAVESGGLYVLKDPASGNYGARDEKGEIAVKFLYNRLTPFVGGFARAVIGETTFVIDRNGKQFAWPSAYDGVHRLEKTFLFQVEHGDMRGLISGEGKIILPVRFSDLDVLATRKGKRIKLGLDTPEGSRHYGLAALDGTILLEPIYDSIEPLGSEPDIEFLRLKKPGSELLALADADGHLLTGFDIVRHENESADGPWMLYGTSLNRLLLLDGTLIPLPAETKEVQQMPDSTVLVHVEGAYSLSDAQGKPIGKPYVQIDYLGDGLWSAQTSFDSEDIIDSSANVVYTMPPDLMCLALLPATSPEARRLLTMAKRGATSQGSAYGLLDWQHDGRRIALPENTSDAETGDSGQVSLSLSDGSAAFADAEGRILTSIKATHLNGMRHGVAIASRPGTESLSGLITASGQWVFPPRYSQMQDADAGFTWGLDSRDSIELINAAGRPLGRRIRRGQTEVWIPAAASPRDTIHHPR